MYSSRIAVPGFGKRSRPCNDKKEPKLKWISDMIFETEINGERYDFMPANYYSIWPENKFLI